MSKGKSNLSKSDLSKFANELVDKLDSIDKKGVIESQEGLFVEDEKEGVRNTKAHMEEVKDYSEVGREIIEESLKKKARFTKEEYKKALAEIFTLCLMDVEFPFGFDWRVLVTQKGVAIAFTDSHKLLYSKGFTETGDVKKDLNAIDLLVLQTENTINRIVREDKIYTQTNEREESKVSRKISDRLKEGGVGEGDYRRGIDFKRAGGKRVPQRPI